MITNQQSQTCIDEIADGIYRISTPMEVPALPGGFSFNQFLILDEDPVLFHTGYRKMFPLVAEAISTVMPVERLRHVGYSHWEPDESGAIESFLTAAPNARPLTSDIGAMITGFDFMDRPATGMASGQRLNIGKRNLRWICTPHIPHGWDCGVLFDEATGTLLCGDLFTQGGSKLPPITESDILEPSEMFRKPLD